MDSIFFHLACLLKTVFGNKVEIMWLMALTKALINNLKFTVGLFSLKISSSVEKINGILTSGIQPLLSIGALYLSSLYIFILN